MTEASSRVSSRRMAGCRGLLATRVRGTAPDFESTAGPGRALAPPWRPE